MPRFRTALVSTLALLVAPALFAMNTQNPRSASPAVPGTLNYVEGSVSVNGQPVTQQSVGSVILQPGESISTANGRAEVLLTPGVYFRLGHDSAAKMVSPELTNTSIALERGDAAVEADQIFKENDVHVLENNVPVQLVKPGLYEFNANRDDVMVFSGQAAALKPDGKFVAVKKDHDLNLSEGVTQKPVKFNAKAQENSGLYRWSSLRSDYLSQANAQIAGNYGPTYAPGWYWDPWTLGYTFIGPSPFYSPFGWAYYPLGGAGLGWSYPGWGYPGWGYPGWGYGGYVGGTHWVGPHGPLNLPRGHFGPNPGVSGHAGMSDGHGGFRGNAFRSGGSMGSFHGGAGFGGFHGGARVGGGHGR